jgi:hypothetical protein
MYSVFMVMNYTLIGLTFNKKTATESSGANKICMYKLQGQIL